MTKAAWCLSDRAPSWCLHAPALEKPPRLCGFSSGANKSQASGGGGGGKGWEGLGGQGRACFFLSTGKHSLCRLKEGEARERAASDSVPGFRANPIMLKKAKKGWSSQLACPGRAGIRFLEPSRKGLISKWAPAREERCELHPSSKVRGGGSALTPLAAFQRLTALTPVVLMPQLQLEFLRLPVPPLPIFFRDSRLTKLCDLSVSLSPSNFRTLEVQCCGVWTVWYLPGMQSG